MASTKETGILTVAAIRKVKGETQVFFSEKQAIFTLGGGKAGRETAALLKEALRRKQPVKAHIDTREGTIHRVGTPSERELREFERLHVLLEKPEKTLRLDVSSIDPTVFNLIDYHRKIRCFRLCRRIIPSYRKAKKIFDFCAKQTCSLGGPFNVSPCIPFQYVRDGCYARAHKMRWIITTKYHYCCEKVFSFAVYSPDTLAVQANKWGGCCVRWWYHVAPLVRVRLGRWAYAHVSLYSIQPGTAYAPSGGWTTFSTDPNYVATDWTLNQYKNLKTC